MAKAIKYYWNAAAVAIATVAYFLPLIVPFQPGQTSGKFVGVAMLLFLYFLGGWLIALVQCGVAIYGFVERRPAWKHHAAAAVCALLCYVIWVVLVSNGFVVTV